MAEGCVARGTVFITAPVAPPITVIVFAAYARTYAVFVVGLTATAKGISPTATFVVAPVRPSRMETLALSSLTTYVLLARLSTAMAQGCLPAGTLVTVLVEPSFTLVSLLP